MAAVSDKQEGLSEVPSLGPYHTPVEKESLEENVDVIESAEGGVDDHVTLKTWLVILMLAWSYGASYWPVTSLSTIQTHIATVLGQPSQAVWFISVYNIAITSTFMVSGSNSDLFGRRYFIIGGNVLMVVGTIVIGSAQNLSAVIAGMALSGIGGANCSLAVFAIPELLPNKWRHIGVAIADTSIMFDVIMGPSVTRFVTTSRTTWRWVFYANAITNATTGVLLFLFYYPPKHPRGIPWARALKEVDYMGGLLFAAATATILCGIAYASFLPSSDPHVVAMLVCGFAAMIAFALWETFAPLKQPLAPTRLFTHNRGQTLSVPFFVAALVTVYYLAINIIWGTMVSIFFARSTSDGAKLSLVQGFGFMAGAAGSAYLGGILKRWRTMMFASSAVATIFGGLLALSRPDTRGLSIAFTFLNSMGYGWAQIMSITFCQFGADQVELGISGGLAGVARYGGGAIAGTVFTTILSNGVSSNLYRVTDAATSAGATESVAGNILATIALGKDRVLSIPGVTLSMYEAAYGAYLKAYELGLRTTCLASIAFGLAACIGCLFLEDISGKMTPKIEVFLENDVNARKNKYH